MSCVQGPWLIAGTQGPQFHKRNRPVKSRWILTKKVIFAIWGWGVESGESGQFGRQMGRGGWLSRQKEQSGKRLGSQNDIGFRALWAVWQTREWIQGMWAWLEVKDVAEELDRDPAILTLRSAIWRGKDAMRLKCDVSQLQLSLSLLGVGMAMN